MVGNKLNYLIRDRTEKKEMRNRGHEIQEMVYERAHNVTLLRDLIREIGNGFSRRNLMTWDR